MIGRYGAFLTVAAKLRSGDREQALALRKRKGKRAFDDQNCEHASA
jgi:hypothetical protein